jgi:lipopolysaccharide biosynthesis protein
MNDGRNNAANEQDALGDVSQNAFSILHNKLGERTEKLCLFASYNFTDEIAAYVLYYLSELKKEGFTIAFVTTSRLTDASMGKLKSFCELIVERENRGIDFGSWQVGLQICNWARNCKEVLIVNDSVFGPLHDLGPIISAMNKRFDIWGMTDSYEVNYHIQSYFLYFNEQVIKSQTWLDFWQRMDFTGLSKWDIIVKYEVGLSQTFFKAGFRLGAYAQIETINQSIGAADKEINASVVYWKMLIEKFDFPFFKREILIKPFIYRAYWPQKGIYINTSNWHRVIEQETAYPITLIEDFLQAYFQHATAENPRFRVKKKKILFITHNAEEGNSTKVFLYFLRWLRTHTDIPVEVVIASGNEISPLYDEFANLCPTSQFLNLSEPERANLKDRLTNESIGLIFSNDLANVGVQKFFSFLNAPQVLYVNEWPYEISNIPVIKNNRDWFKRNITRFITGVDTVKERLKEYFELDEQSIDIVRQFIDEPEEREQEEGWMLTHELNIPYGSFIVGVSGMFDGRLAADLILAIAAMLCKQHTDIHFIWIDNDAVSLFHKSLEIDFKKAGINGHVHFIPKQKNAADYYAFFDVFLMLTKADSLPLVNLEVGLRGVPVICFENSAIATDYTALGLGRAVPYMDVAAMRDAVLDYYKNKAKLKSDARSMVDVVKRNFITTVQAPKLYALLNTYYCEKEIVPAGGPIITIMVHLFYENTWKDIKYKLNFFKDYNTQFLFSVSEACLIKEELVQDIRASFKNAYVLTTSNIGKDIGGKFALIDLYLSLNLQSEYFIFLHDKVSPHSLDGNSWKNNLQKIIDYNNYSHIVTTLEQDGSVGVIGAKEHLVNEYDPANGTFEYNNDRIHSFLQKYDIPVSNYDFIGGTMYWIRAPLIENFFTRHSPLKIRSELEAGNVMDNLGSTNAHTWERIFCWLATSQGYKVYGI